MSNNDFAAILETLPKAEELRSRAEQLSKTNDDVTFESFEKFDRYFWEDGAGNEAYIIFRADGVNEDSILMFAYDHESSWNYYDSDITDFIVFHGLPDDFKHLLNEPKLKWEWDTSEPDEDKVVQATAVAWLEHGSEMWEASDDFVEQVSEKSDNGGFTYVFSHILNPDEDE